MKTIFVPEDLEEGILAVEKALSEYDEPSRDFILQHVLIRIKQRKNDVLRKEMASKSIIENLPSRLRKMLNNDYFEEGGR